MAPSKRLPPLSIAIPSSLVSDIPHPREKTLRVGLIGRALAIFRVDEVVTYPDIPGRNQREDTEFTSLILSYMEAPQYLRKHLFPIRPSLRYAGILPPLRTPHHPTARHVVDLRLGEFREGVILKSTRKRSYVDIGVEKLAELPEVELPAGRRVTVRIREFRHNIPMVGIANPAEITIYWGYRVTVCNSTLGRMLKGGMYDLVVATSRHGDPIAQVIQDIKRRWIEAKSVLVAFGSPNEGLQEILGRDNLKLEEMAQFTVNTIPVQGTETVRTEEAVYASLAIMNVMI